MSAFTSIRRAAINNKRFYTTAPPAGPKNGSGNGPLFLFLAAAGGAGFYLYQRKLEAQKGPIEKKGEVLDQKVREAKEQVNEKIEDTKSRFEQSKIEARQAAENKAEDAKEKFQDLKKEGANQFEATKQAAIEKGGEAQKAIGDKVADAGKNIKERA